MLLCWASPLELVQDRSNGVPLRLPSTCATLGRRRITRPARFAGVTPRRPGGMRGADPGFLGLPPSSFWKSTPLIRGGQGVHPPKQDLRPAFSLASVPARLEPRYRYASPKLRWRPHHRLCSPTLEQSEAWGRTFARDVVRSWPVHSCRLDRVHATRGTDIRDPNATGVHFWWHVRSSRPRVLGTTQPFAGALTKAMALLLTQMLCRQGPAAFCLLSRADGNLVHCAHLENMATAAMPDPGP